MAPKRDTYRGEMIDPKAYALGRLANMLRGDGPMPTVAESRAQMAKIAATFDKKGPAVARIEDIEVAGANGLLKARLYSDHTDIAPARPALVYYHGGGFIQGDLDTHHETCLKLAKRWGGVVIAVDYRLAPENPYPAGVDDAKMAYLDVVARAAELGISPQNVGVGGDSAGGCFAAVVAQQVRNEGGSIPLFQVLIYPVTDGNMTTDSIRELEFAYVLPKARMTWYRDQYAGDFSDFNDPKFSPLMADDFSNLPDTYILTGGFDPLMDDGALYAQKLEQAGINVTYRHFPGQIHAFINLTKVIPEGTQALDEIADWLPDV
ncbi:MAG: alpha/beta hydrolase [Rhodobacterales bacterium]|nr:alpha/beta hydrolase [Rhodobacterales bacterium]